MTQFRASLKDFPDLDDYGGPIDTLIAYLKELQAQGYDYVEFDAGPNNVSARIGVLKREPSRRP